MEEAKLEPGTTDATAEIGASEEDQQEVSYVNGQGWQFKNFHPNPNVGNNQHLFSYKTNSYIPYDRSQGNQSQNHGYPKQYPQNQNGKMFILSQAQNQYQNKQNNPHAAPATASGPPDELKGMMQQLLQGRQIQEKALNQVTNEINTRMDNMFTELNSKYDAVASHIRQMDVQIAQTAETIKRQQGTLPGKTDKNPQDCNAVELRSGRNIPDPIPKKLTAKEKGKTERGRKTYT
ncbi:hypothetical protein F2Q68_00031692 [Brassica cretica]|uniref:Uncharacterized protein n=1 Tax=Brassica cretica TaxID=69181 RepID=A0A8S9GC67_BRACR|nr:hypothetical protein F2Q68_00031692 [Brassica cretica]